MPQSKNSLIYLTLRRYIIAFIGVMFVGSLVLIFVENAIWQDDVDEILYDLKEKTILTLELNGPEMLGKTGQYHSLFDHDIYVQKLDYHVADSDSLFTTEFFSQIEGHNETVREIVSYANIGGITYRLQFKKEVLDQDKLTTGIVIAQLLIHACFIIVLVYIMRAMSKRQWAPFFNMNKQMRQLKLDNPQPIDTDCKGITEFEELRKSVNILIEDNHKLIEQQKEYTENTMHEMQTPLAVMNNKISELLNTPLNEEQSKALFSMFRHVKYMSTINKNMLLLSRIEHHQYIADEAVDFKQIVDEYISLMQENVEVSDKHLEYTLENCTLLNCNELLATSICNNLLGNAIKYSASESTIEVKLDRNHFIVRNEGLDKPLNTGLIYQRFVRGDSKKEGTGLGLSIVYEACKQMGYKLRYNYIGESKHEFTIRFRSNSE